MPSLPGYDIRYMHLQDASYLREWLLFPGMLHHFPMSDEKEVDDMVQSWMGFCRYNCGLTAVINDIPCAMGVLFLMPYRKVAHHCIFNMIVDPKWQKQGIGKSLLKNLKHLAKNYFRVELMLIDIFVDNPLHSLLEKQGFCEIVRQEDYVKEDGLYRVRILMEGDLT